MFGALHECACCIEVFDDTKDRVAKAVVRNGRQSKQATKWAWNMCTKHWRQPQCAYVDAARIAQLGCLFFDGATHTAIRGIRIDWCCFNSDARRVRTWSVNLDAAAHNHCFQRLCLMRCVEHGLCNKFGAQFGFARGKAGMWFPHADMQQHVWVEILHQFGNAVMLRGVDANKTRTLQHATWRINIETKNVAGPIGIFNHRPDERTQFSAHAGDEYATPLHGNKPTCLCVLVCERAGSPQVMHTQDELARPCVELASANALGDDDCL